MKIVIMTFVERVKLTGVVPVNYGFLGDQPGSRAASAPINRLVEAIRFTDDERQGIKTVTEDGGRTYSFYPQNEFPEVPVKLETADSDLLVTLLEDCPTFKQWERALWVDPLADRIKTTPSTKG